MSKRPERSPRGERPSRGPKRGAAGPGRGPKKSFGDRPPRREKDDREGASRPRSGGERSSKPRPGRDDDRRPPREGEERRGPGPRSTRPPRDGEERHGTGPRGGRPPRASGDADRRPARPGGKGRFSDDRKAPGRKTGAARPEKPWTRQGRDERSFKEGDPLARRPFRKGERSNRFSLPNPANEGLIRLNRYLANAGVGSRREADVLIATGAVTVNGKVVTELGTKVDPGDVIHFGGQKLSLEQKRYVLLNKPKDTLTTTDDPQERHTVMSLVAKACPERLYPVGRLDRNTTGVLLLTNDGDLAKKLTHPSHGAEKIYHVTLDKTVAAADLQQLVKGVPLDDGPAQADEANYVASSESRREVGLKLHMGRNRIVRRMFEALGYEVVKLDRVLFAGLTKKDLQRGHWRHLTEKEVAWLLQMKEPPQGSKAERGGRRKRLSQGSE